MAPLTIGLVADTHGQFRPQLTAVLAGVHLIVHAGDVGGAAVLAALRSIAPVEAVSGNVDDRHDPALPRHRTLVVGGLTLHVSHGDELGRPRPETLLASYDADIVVYGHTHKALVFRTADGRLVVNPGAAGPRRFDLQPSVALLTIANGRAEAEVIQIA